VLEVKIWADYVRVHQEVGGIDSSHYDVAIKYLPKLRATNAVQARNTEGEGKAASVKSNHLM
jgi:hypothetical protein